MGTQEERDLGGGLEGEGGGCWEDLEKEMGGEKRKDTSGIPFCPSQSSQMMEA